MSYQCKNCEREKDQNNNYVNATYSANVHGTRGNRNAAARIAGSDRITRNSAANVAANNNNESVTGGGTGSATAGTGTTQVTAKVMWGSVGAIKELREKEQAERNNQVTRAGRRQ